MVESSFRVGREALKAYSYLTWPLRHANQLGYMSIACHFAMRDFLDFQVDGNEERLRFI